MTINTIERYYSIEALRKFIWNHNHAYEVALQEAERRKEERDRYREILSAKLLAEEGLKRGQKVLATGEFLRSQFGHYAFLPDTIAEDIIYISEAKDSPEGVLVQFTAWEPNYLAWTSEWHPIANAKAMRDAFLKEYPQHREEEDN